MNMLGLNMRANDWPGWFALTQCQGVPPTVTLGGIAYTRIRVGTAYLDQIISTQPLYGRATS